MAQIRAVIFKKNVKNASKKWRHCAPTMLTFKEKKTVTRGQFQQPRASLITLCFWTIILSLKH